MTLKMKIEQLLKYCGQCHAHGYMMDERNPGNNFSIIMPEEEEIQHNIEKLKLILLTGEAGDGKSHMLNKLRPLLRQNGFSEPCSDFSALTEADRSAVIERMMAIIDGRSDEKLFILANVGIFVQTVIQNDIHIMEELTSNREDIFVCNFENRNLAEDASFFGNMMKEFLQYEETYDCKGCPWEADCVYKTNIDILLSESGVDAMRTICNAIYLTGGHLTFRELLSLLSYAVTFGQDCLERRDLYAEKQAIEGQVYDQMSYYNIFAESEDILLHKVASMDPAKKRNKGMKSINSGEIETKEDYIRSRRRYFFEYTGPKYIFLNVDYLTEFSKALDYVNTPPYNYDIAHDKSIEFQTLKNGIRKMGNRGNGDTGLVVTDTPLIFDNQIQIEFMLMQDMTMIWHRYDLQLGKKAEESKHLWNKFYLSYIAKDEDTGERKLISLLIDYKQFRYLMMCSKDYFMNRNELSVEEYAVNTFYRKILQETKQAYDSFVIRFGEKKEEMCDFSLMVHMREDIFSGEKKATIRIKKED